MARQLRIQLSGACYLVSNKSESRNGLFRSDSERQIFIDCLLETCEKTGWIVHSYSLVKDGYFLLLETPEPNLVDGMKWFQGAFTAKVNKLRNRRESLFQRRYRSVIIDPKAKDNVFRAAADYVHTAPALNKSAKGDLAAYEWSSLKDYASAKTKRAKWVTVDKILKDAGLKDDAAGRMKYVNHVTDVAKRASGSKPDPEIVLEWKNLKRGWYIGSDKFLNDLTGAIAKAKAGKVSGKSSPKNIHGEAMAKNIIQSGLKAIKIKESDLAKLPLGSDYKIALATVLRDRTTISQDWISKKLKMGHRTNVSNGITKVKADDGGSLTKLVRAIEKSIK